MQSSIKHVSAQDVFLRLLVMVSMYLSAIAMIVLLFQLINLNVADPLSNDYYYGMGRPYLGPLRFAISALIVIFPALLISACVQNRSYKKDKKKLKLELRKWLIYLTLFVAALVMLGDLIWIVYSYLAGDLTLRFTLKALSMIVVLGLVFVYSFWDLKRAKTWKGIKFFAWAVSIFVLTTLITGFLTVGSPAKERMYRFDSERVEDLESIQWQITDYWQHKQVLPASLEDLNDEISGYLVPSDPDTDQAYEYRVLRDKTFELCATFQKISPSLENPRLKSDYMQEWEHKDGKVCFERTIDEDIYSID